MTSRLATTVVISRLIGLRGRAIVTAKGHHLVVDSPLSLGGPNEEVNPVDLLLSALATSNTFVCERAAQEIGIPIQKLSVIVMGDLDPRGTYGEPVDPRIQAVRVRVLLAGPTAEQAEMLCRAIRARCPVYATLSRAVEIEIETVLEQTADAASDGNKSEITQ
ncbi:MAG: OsmC family protein [Burkholderiales bacterium]|nr:OsmC family protein [Anaerolineae bacterium]